MRGSSHTRLAIGTAFIIAPITDRDNCVLVASYMYWMKVYTSAPLHIITHCPQHCHCDYNAAKVKAVTIIAEQRT